MKRNICHYSYKDIISMENLLAAWQEFIKDKRRRLDVQVFESELFMNISDLHNELKDKTYKHGGYKAFKVADQKPRDIHKASVRDRLVHHAVYRILRRYFEKIFIPDSFSCQKGKGTHKALLRFAKFVLKVSKNKTKPCFVLKCDIRKFFASIDQSILLDILNKNIEDKDIVNLLSLIIGSFYSTETGKGLPLGNLTSQLLVNIYMNEFDQYAKHNLKIKYYIRYADDFVILSSDMNDLKGILPKVDAYLKSRLKLNLHPDKVFIKSIVSGVDFLGWVHFYDHRVLRTSTKKKMFRQMNENQKQGTKESYLGMLKHGNGWKLKERLSNVCILSLF